MPSFDPYKILTILRAGKQSSVYIPETAGDRERAKFRPSRDPKLITVAVANDDGGALASEDTLVSKMDELIREIRLLRHALVLQGAASSLEDVLG